MPNYQNLAGAVSGFSGGLMQGMELADRRRARNLQEAHLAQQQEQQQIQNDFTGRRMTLAEQEAQQQAEMQRQNMGLAKAAAERQAAESEARIKHYDTGNKLTELTLEQERLNQPQKIFSLALVAAASGNNNGSLELIKQLYPGATRAQIDDETGNFIVQGKDESGQPFSYEQPPVKYGPNGMPIGGWFMQVPGGQQLIRDREKQDGKTPKMGPGDKVAALQDFGKYYNIEPYDKKENKYGMKAPDYAGITDWLARGESYGTVAKAFNLTPRDETDPAAVANTYQAAIDQQNKKGYQGRGWDSQADLSKEQANLEIARQNMKKGLTDIARQRAEQEAAMQTKTYQSPVTAATRTRPGVEPLVEQGAGPAARFPVVGQQSGISASEPFHVPRPNTYVSTEEAISSSFEDPQANARNLNNSFRNIDMPVQDAGQKRFDSNNDGKLNQNDKAVILAIQATEKYDNEKDPIKQKAIEDYFGPLEMQRFRALKAAYQKKVKGQAEKHVGLTR